jgi:predicted HD phosphohydrolase
MQVRQGANVSNHQLSQLKHIVQDALNQQHESFTEYTYTLIAHDIGKRVTNALGGVWSCIVGKYFEEQSDKLEFSFHVSAVRYQCFLVKSGHGDEQHFVYIGQIYDPLCAIRALHQSSSQWNMS